MPEINFPAINGTDGSSCDVYSFGFTSECTNADGTNRGFTQDWFFDGTIGAWVSVTVGTTGGGGAIIDGFTYDAFPHEAPTMSGSGDIRQIAFLDPVTGGLTFDYIKTYDVVNPQELEFDPVNNFRWLTVTNSLYFPNNVLNNKNGAGDTVNLTPGVTLCGDTNHQFNIGSSTDTNTGYRWYINREPNDEGVSEFRPSPVNSDEQYALHPVENSNFTIKTPPGVPADDVFPKSVGQEVFADYNTGNSGEILLDNGANDGAAFGFTTSGGPLMETFAPQLRYAETPGGAVSGAERPGGTRVLRHENWIYFAGVRATGGINTPADALDLVGENNGAKLKLERNTGDNNDQLYGQRSLLDPMTNRSSGNNWNGEVNNGRKTHYQQFLYTLTQEDFGFDEGVTDYFPIIAIPTRALPNAGNETANKQEFCSSIYQVGTDSNASGFELANTTTVNITNEYNYTEEYTVFCSVQPSGIGTSEPQFKIDMGN